MTDDRRTAQRADIQALRAVAVLVVVLYHLWPQRLTGGYVGVDVFFVISGFLITSHIVRDVEAGRFSVVQFWSRRLLRLLPASLLVLAVTAAGVWALAPPQHWEQWFREIAAAGLYAQNWVLAGDAVDYMAADNVASPVQHYWSLSTEEQFYLVWPLLIGACVLATRFVSTRLRPRGPASGQTRGQAAWRAVTAGMLALLVIASLITSILWTASDQAYAYFITPTRAWEFGAGALLAFVPALGDQLAARTEQPGTPAGRHTALSPGLTAALAPTAVWTGLALIVVSAVLFTDATPFPGAWAAVPVVGTLLVIWARTTDRFTTRVAGLQPVQFLGDVSYAVYLWHWPLVVLVPYLTGHDLRTLEKLAILAVTLVLAWATRRWVERPVLGQRHRFKPWTTFAGAAVAGSLVVGAAFVGVTTIQNHMQAELEAAKAADAQCLGAAARPPSAENCVNDDLEGTALPAPEAAQDDGPEAYAAGTAVCRGTTREDAEPHPCEQGDQDSDVRIALVGDSHAAHYSSAFIQAADDEGWAVDIYLKQGCPFSDVMRVQETVLTGACVEWVDRAEDMLVDGDYDLVVTSQLSGVEWEPPSGTRAEAYAEEGLKTLWTRLADEGMAVAAVADVPKPDPEVIDCLTARDADVAASCRVPRDEATKPFDPQVGAVEQLDRPDVSLIDLTDVYCDEKECLPVIGGVTVYRDDNHLTDTFAATLAPYVADELRPLVPGAGDQDGGQTADQVGDETGS